MAGRGKTHKTYEKIMLHLRESISSGELKPGDRLPPETDLARSLGVSRPTVREALKVLEAMSILRSSTGPTGGTFVRAIDGLSIAEHLSDSITLLMDVDEMTLAELCEAREAVEIPAVGMAAARRTDSDLQAMKKIIEADEEMILDSLFSDISFHRAIADASKNGMLNLFMSSIHMVVRTLADRYILPEVKQVSQQQHQRIYRAVLSRNPEEARSAMRDHLRFAYDVYRQAIPKKGLEEAGAVPPTEHSSSGYTS